MGNCNKSVGLQKT
jgi:hypothetical protein